MAGPAMKSSNVNNVKQKVVFVLGATGAGKSRLAIDLAGGFPAEIINSDKMQVYKGLDIVTNKVTKSEQLSVPHHLIGEVDPEADFTKRDFCSFALEAIDKVLRLGRIPIIVGGSNSFIEALVEDLDSRSKCETCFVWVDVSIPVLHSFVAKRVDQMIVAGLVDEVRAQFIPGSDYTRGIRRSIGVPELDEYLKMETKLDRITKEKLLKEAIDEVKENTRQLVCKQLCKIQRLRNEKGWLIHRIDVTPVFQRDGKEAERAWEELVVRPSLDIVNGFLLEKK